MNYGEVLTRAWKIIWKFKVLWIFGIFASCGTGSNGGGGGSGNNVSYQFSNGELPPQFEQFFGNFDRFINDMWWIFGLIICLTCVLVLVAIFLSTIGKIALIKGTLKAEEGAERMGFVELFNASTPYFWRVFGLSLLLFFIFFVLVMLGVLVFMGAAMVTFGIAMICLVPLCCLLIPVMWAIGVILEQAYIAIVVEDRGIADGLSRGWEVVKSHWEPMLVMGIILIFGGAIAGLIIAIPMFLVMFPLFFALGFSGSDSMAPLAIGGICFLIYLPVLIVAGGILKAYVQSAWTLTFLRVTGHGPSLEPVPAEPEPPLPPLEPVNA
jgi:hypothetical protein